MDSLVKDPEIRVKIYILTDSLPEGHDYQNKLATTLKTEIGKQLTNQTHCLSGLLNTQLNSLYKQTNKNCWKFDFNDADNAKWGEFKDAMTANTTVFSDNFTTTKHLLNLNAMWSMICKVMLLSVDEMIFRRKWFKSFDGIFIKESSRFHKLKLLVSKIIKVFCEEDSNRFAFLMRCWDSLNNVKTSIVQEIVVFGASFNYVCLALFSI
ncbi:hypothetical protein G9A89_023651 [Geosiphon pyriformis]|nr:hypothetical protein G9A89_023651 [Geosiphon pyriformis]